MAIKIAVANQKGGVGKTTTTYNLATAKVRVAGKRVLQIDMDPQFNLLESCKMRPDDPVYEGFSTCSLFDKNIDPLDCIFTVDSLGNNTNLFIVPSTINLAVTAKELYSNSTALATFRQHIIELDKYFDYIFFDCPPTLDELLLASLVSADGVIIPTKPEELSYGGLKLILGTIEDVRKSPSGNKDLETLGLIATMYRSQVSEHQTILADMTSKYNVLGIIPQSAVVTKGFPQGLPVVVTHPQSKAAKAYISIANNL